MDLLEREAALGALAAAYSSAERGEGRVVLVTGEPGIGKTSVVTRFLEGLGPGTRVLVGTCDDLSIPRPLGPFRDFAPSVSGPFARALEAGAAPHEIQAHLVSEVELPPQPTVVVLEDVHWADEATLDSITVLGRRIGTLPALLVLTFRAGDAPPGHPLHATLAAIPATSTEIVELAPLSRNAVSSLAGERAARVYAVTNGNPFYVRELLCSGGSRAVPPTVVNAVRGRAARLDPASRRLVELVSVIPSRAPVAVLEAVMPGWLEAAEEPERRQLLEVGHGFVRFRHELARHAILSGIPIAARRRLHAEILTVLLASDADPAEIVHHAVAADDHDVVADYARLAARRAAALESHREALGHYQRAAALADRLPPAEQAAVFDELSQVAYTVGQLDDAFAAAEKAIQIYGELGDRLALGECTRAMSRLHWYAGDGRAARRSAHEAVAILEPLGESVQLAGAYSAISQLAMLEEDTRGAIEWGEKALDLATRLGDEPARAHALVNLGTARMLLAPDDSAVLLDAFAVADRACVPHEAGRALLNLGYTLMSWVRPEPALHYAQQAFVYCEEHEMHSLGDYATAMIAWLRARSGEWAEAEELARGVVDRSESVLQIVAKTVLVELAVRRGDPDATVRLADVREQAGRTGELQRLCPVFELGAESALVGAAPMPKAELAGSLAFLEEERGDLSGVSAARLGAWAAVAGLDVDVDASASAPFAAMTRRDWARAADAFGEVGWDYDRALMLSLTDDEELLVEAIGIARRLGAKPLARRVAGRMRELRLSVPRGPRPSTTANPAGLTGRQLEVLALLREGLSNAEIADRLVVSPRTAEHHVAAVLAKLGATTRWDAVRRASNAAA
jgi:DNA-binding CsgD family transcriptional regulator/tetratricopeptide (TPR) repeat protein